MPVLTTIDVTGMTCGHCVSAVTSELSGVDGVERVTVELVNGGTSHVTAFSDVELAADAIRAAIDEAGYDVVGISSHGATQEFAALAEVRSESKATGAANEAAAAASESDGGVGPVGISLTTKPSGESPAGGESAGGCGCGCGDH